MNWKQRLYSCSIIALIGYYLGIFYHPYFSGGTSFLIGYLGLGPLLKWIYRKLGD